MVFPTLYTMNLSPPCRAVEMTARHLAIKLNYVTIDLLKKEQLSEDFVKINPQHTVPTLVDGDVVLWDSHAIMIYLVEKFARPTSLYPDNLATRAKIHQHLHFEGGVLFARLRFINEPLFFFNWKTIPEDRIDYALKAFELLEAVLQKSSYLVGNSLTLADLSCVTTVTTLVHELQFDTAKFPRLHAWLKQFEKLPYFEELNQKGARTVGELFRAKVAENAKQA